MTKPVLGNHTVQGAGLGLRRVHFDSLADHIPSAIGFMEVAPENWIDVGGKSGRQFRAIAERVPLVAHGLSLNIGGPAPLDETFLHRIRQFLDTYNVRVYSDHLSYCTDDAHLYDLMPIPFTEDAVHYVAERIRRTQDIIGRRMAIENVSYYAAPGKEMEEIDFINAILTEADCLLHLDINNIYVNSVNHNFDAEAFLRALPGERIAYAHIAGHNRVSDHLIIDTHGADVIDPVWHLLDVAYAEFGVFPTLLERDFDIPSLEEMLKEVDIIRGYQQKHTATCRTCGVLKRA
ncbi:MAG: HvfB family MNIO-type RiPP peptide maturase [Gammaproteobacteria bacterium]